MNMIQYQKHIEYRQPLCFECFDMLGADEPSNITNGFSSIRMQWKTKEGFFKKRPDSGPNQIIFDKNKNISAISWFKTLKKEQFKKVESNNPFSILDNNRDEELVHILDNKKGPAFITFVGSRRVYFYYINGIDVGEKMSSFFKQHDIEYTVGEKISEENFALFIMNYTNGL